MYSVLCRGLYSVQCTMQGSVQCTVYNVGVNIFLENHFFPFYYDSGICMTSEIIVGGGGYQIYTIYGLPQINQNY